MCGDTEEEDAESGMGRKKVDAAKKDGEMGTTKRYQGTD